MRWFFTNIFDNKFLAMHESAVFERVYSSFHGLGGSRLCMICFRFSGAVVSVGMIIGIFVVAGIIIGYHFWVVRCGVKKGRNKNYNPLTISE